MPVKSDNYQNITMSWLVILAVGIVLGILFAGAYPDMASGINGAIAPPLDSIGHSLVDRLKDATFSIFS